MSKKAFLVGINNFANPNYALRGCINDCLSLTALLTAKYGFQSSDVTMLTDSQATRKAILSGLQSILADARAGDVVVFGVSSHGTQKPATAPGTQPNDMSDALVTYEAKYDALITDAELFSLITSYVKGPSIKFTAIYDCCHSGTMIRDVDFDPATGDMIALVTNRCLFLPWLADVPKKAVEIGPYNAFSACADNETAADIANVPSENRPRGAFSYAVHSLLQKGPLSATALAEHTGPVIKQLSSHLQTPEFYAVDPGALVLQ